MIRLSGPPHSVQTASDPYTPNPVALNAAPSYRGTPRPRSCRCQASPARRSAIGASTAIAINAMTAWVAMTALAVGLASAPAAAQTGVISIVDDTTTPLADPLGPMPEPTETTTDHGKKLFTGSVPDSWIAGNLNEGLEIVSGSDAGVGFHLSSGALTLTSGDLILDSSGGFSWGSNVILGSDWASTGSLTISVPTAPLSFGLTETPKFRAKPAFNYEHIDREAEAEATSLAWVKERGRSLPGTVPLPGLSLPTGIYAHEGGLSTDRVDSSDHESLDARSTVDFNAIPLTMADGRGLAHFVLEPGPDPGTGVDTHASSDRLAGQGRLLASAFTSEGATGTEQAAATATAWASQRFVFDTYEHEVFFDLDIEALHDDAHGDAAGRFLATLEPVGDTGGEAVTLLDVQGGGDFNRRVSALVEPGEYTLRIRAAAASEADSAGEAGDFSDPHYDNLQKAQRRYLTKAKARLYRRVARQFRNRLQSADTRAEKARAKRAMHARFKTLRDQMFQRIRYAQETQLLQARATLLAAAQAANDAAMAERTAEQSLRFDFDATVGLSEAGRAAYEADVAQWENDFEAWREHTYDPWLEQVWNPWLNLVEAAASGTADDATILSLRDELAAVDLFTFATADDGLSAYRVPNDGTATLGDVNVPYDGVQSFSYDRQVPVQVFGDKGEYDWGPTLGELSADALRRAAKELDADDRTLPEMLLDEMIIGLGANPDQLLGGIATQPTTHYDSPDVAVGTIVAGNPGNVDIGLDQDGVLTIDTGVSGGTLVFDNTVNVDMGLGDGTLVFGDGTLVFSDNISISDLVVTGGTLTFSPSASLTMIPAPHAFAAGLLGLAALLRRGRVVKG